MKQKPQNRLERVLLRRERRSKFNQAWAEFEKANPDLFSTPAHKDAAWLDFLPVGGHPAAQPAAQLPRLDERKLSNRDRRVWWEANGRDTSLLVDSLSNEPAPAERISLEPYLRQLQEQRREKAEQRKAEIEKGAVDLRHADPSVVAQRLRDLGIDDAPLVSGLRRHGLDEQSGATSHQDGVYGERIKLWRSTYESARAAGRSDSDARDTANRAAPPPGTPLPPTKRQERERSPRQGKRAPPPRADARKMTPVEWQTYLQARGLSQPTP